MGRAYSGFLVIFISDQLIKLWLLRSSADFALGTLIALHPVRNTNGLFSVVMPQWLIILLSILFSAAVLWVWQRAHRTRHTLIELGCLALLLGGVSNLLDRIFRGAVIDYIDIADSFSVFNLADMLILWGVVLIGIDLWHTRDQHGAGLTTPRGMR